MLKDCDVCHWKVENLEFQFVFRCFPTPFGQRNVATYIYNICKGQHGSRGDRVVHAKEDNKHLTNVNRFAKFYFLGINRTNIHV